MNNQSHHVIVILSPTPYYVIDSYDKYINVILNESQEFTFMLH